MVIWAILYLLVFGISIALLTEAGHNREKGQDLILTLHWLPFVPVLWGLLAGAVILVGIMPALALVGAAWPTIGVWLGFVFLFGALGLLCYWTPIAWFVHQVNGNKFVLAW